MFNKLSTSEILQAQSHRNWPPPDKKWLFYQEWHNVLFAHWKVELSELRKFVPETFEIDMLNGNAWVSLIIFTIKNIRPRYLPPFTPVSDFNEINIRTYIRYKNKEGIYFLNIEAAKWLSGLFAAAFSELPYRHSKIISSPGHYHSFNQNNGDKLQVKFSPGSEYPAGKADRWLTERYVFFQDNTKDKINELNIHHHQWPIYKVGINDFKMNYRRFNNLLPNYPELVHYSPGIQVLTWGKIKHTPGK
jgi:uncharacterized protein